MAKLWLERLLVTFACLIPFLLLSLFAPVPTVCFCFFLADFEIMKETNEGAGFCGY
jgi:hypothetical protein